jgi:uncharacterized protein (DUF1810 family)
VDRFISAQDSIYQSALSELRAGHKRSHWMWFIFPQIDGLGTSTTAKHYAIRSLEEPRDYLNHPVLGARLSECTMAVVGVNGRSALDFFGSPDNLKFCSSMTLFECVAGRDSDFSHAIEKYFAGKRDAATLRLIRGLDESKRI